MGVFRDTADAFKRGVEGGDGVYEVAGARVTCAHCGGQRFERDVRLLSSRGLSFLDADWLNAGAHVYICKDCGHLEWFVSR